MPDSGRTQRVLSLASEAAPQRIDLGHGKAATIAGMALVTRAALNVPFFGGRAQRGRRPTAAA
jgi:hypothetical protein